MPWRKNRKTLSILIITILTAIALFLVGRAYYVRMANRVAVEVEEEESKITAPNKEEEIARESSLPENFPDDFPIYENAKLSSSWAAKGKETEGISVIWETNSQVKEVSEYYKRELAKGGWEITLASEAEDSTTFSFEKGEIGGFIGLTTKGKGTIISVTLGVK